MRACRLVAACLVLAAAAPAAAETPPVTVETLGPVTPGNAPGQALYLIRYRIAAGTRLPLHHHEGTQIGLVEAGVLTYHVATGEVPVYAAGADGATVAVRTVRAGETAEILPGQWVVEEADAHHWGANLGGEPLVITTSALLRAGAPLATRDQP